MVMADQVVILDQGKIAWIGSSTEVYRGAPHLYVAARSWRRK